MQLAPLDNGRDQLKGALRLSKLREQAFLAAPAKIHHPATAPSKFIFFGGAIAVNAFVVGTGGSFTAAYVTGRDVRGYRLQDFDYGERPPESSFEDVHVRSPADDLTRVREVFAATVTELSSMFGVSRQAIYNWQHGHAVAHENEVRLAILAKAADILDRGGLAGQRSILRRKLPSGKTLFESMREGGATVTDAIALVALVRREFTQRQALTARLTNRKRRPVDVNEIGSPHLSE